MRKFNIMKGVSTALVAVALVTGLTVPVNAAKTDAQVSTQEVTLAGAATVAAPTISLKETENSGQTTTSWTFTYSPVPAPVTLKDEKGNVTDHVEYELVYAVYDKGDRTKPVVGSYTTDVFGKKVLNGKYIDSYVNPQNNPNYKYEFTISSSSLTPGTKEVVAYLFDEPAYEADLKAARASADVRYQQAEDAYYADTTGTVKSPEWDDYYSEKALGVSKADYYVASEAVTIDVSMETSVSTTVTATSIQLNMSSAGGATGYNIYRKIGKKYKKIATVASYVYLDKGLVSNTTYSYQVVPYYVNSTTGKTTTGKKTTIEATTKGSSLNLQAKVTKKNKVQLTWKKVTGATEYEIYRADTYSSTSTTSKGLYNEYYTYKKIATVKKNKKSYTDKTVAANRDYAYIVRAILPKSDSVKGDKDRVVEGSAWASLDFGEIDVISSYTNATGDKTVNWNKVYGASGYLVEKYTYDPVNETYDWVEYKKLGKNATSVKLPAEITYQKNHTDGQVNEYLTDTTTYRIRAYKGTSTYSDYEQITTTKTLGNVQKVTAKKTTNGVKVSWTKVAGAAYYKVYRVRTDAITSNKDDGSTDVVGDNGNYIRISEYVGYQPATAVDVAAYNAAVDASIAEYKEALKAYDDSTDPNKEEPDETKYFNEKDKLDVNKSYHYQNYSYARDTFDADTTSMIDYYGDIYSGCGEKVVDKTTKGADGKAVDTYRYVYNPIVNDDDVQLAGTGDLLKQGVSYTYYVEAVMATAETVADYNTDAYLAAKKAADTAYEAAWKAYYEELAKYNKGEIAVKPVSPYYDYDDYYRYTYGYKTRTWFDQNGYDDALKAYNKAWDDFRSGITTVVPTIEYPKDEDYNLYYSADYLYAEATTQVAYNTAVTGAFADKSAYATTVTVPSYKDVSITTSGVKKLGTATYTNVSATKKPTLKSVTSSKGSATITIKKKVKKASYYKIYRSTKKKGKYTVAGITKNAKTLKFKDSDVTVGKTYYYKVVAVVKNEAGAEVESAASKIKKVTIKK